jgi:D-alanyl-lipoteichoic acid acyltransferase DltB (MBOAT superfamily)
LKGLAALRKLARADSEYQMLFNSPEFLFAFLPIALLGFYLIGRVRPTLAAFWLSAASLVFYGWMDFRLIVLLAGSFTFNYLMGMAITASPEGTRRRVALLIWGVLANLTLLFNYKYLYPLLGYLHQQNILATDFGSIILPLGISFYTFTQIGYLIDCNSGLANERSFINYVLFVTFFPHLIAGPILHHREIIPQFAARETYKFRIENLSIGLTIFILGLAKKVLIADSIAPWAEAGFEPSQSLKFLAATGTTLSYTLQLYFDFSGYSDMAIGLAKMFGVRFPLNFNSPYKSASIIEFWQRWHMTLTRFLTLYLYNPAAMAIAEHRLARHLPVGRPAAATLSGFSILVLVPTLVTMGLAGIWHGAGFQFLLFGLLHGSYISINHAWRIFFRSKSHLERAPLFAAAMRAAGVLLTFVAVLAAFIFFRAASTADALSVVGSLLGARGIEDIKWPERLGPDLLAEWEEPLVLAALCGVVWLTPNVHEIMGKYSPALAKPGQTRWRALAWRPSVGHALLIVVVFLACIAMLQRTTKFLYFQF